MNFISENMTTIILVAVGMVLTLFFVQYYIRGSIDAEIATLKKRVKKLQAQIQARAENEQSQLLAQRQRMMQLQQQPRPEQGEEPMFMDDRNPSEVDSYFDPTK